MKLSLANLYTGLAPVDQIIDLRHRTLRGGYPIETAHFDGDSDPDTHHFATWLNDPQASPICCASFMLNSYNERTAWQLRGMATEPSHRGRGIGTHLLQAATEHLRSDSSYTQVTTMWCNAREAAIFFYRRHGWIIVSDVFEIPTVGRHYKMMREF